MAVTPVRSQDNGKRQAGEGQYANLTALWWEWVFAQPAVDVGGTNTNPVLDSTGAYATAGQENGIGPGNKFFFLAGTFGGPATRTVTVPEGKTLFFPLINTDQDNAVPDPDANFTVPELRAFAESIIDTVTITFAELDGESLEIFRVKSPTFAYTLPDEDSIYAYFGLLGDQFEGTVKPAVSDGYWVVIPPLPSGDYLLEFGGVTSGGFTQDVMYLLTVE
jgi:hypothetical protein